MTESIFYTADELATELQVSKALAYKMIRRWNQELREAGYTVIQGRVSREYVKEKFYGLKGEKK